MGIASMDFSPLILPQTNYKGAKWQHVGNTAMLIGDIGVMT